MSSKRDQKAQQGIAAAEQDEVTTAMTPEEVARAGYGLSSLGNIPQDKRLTHNPDGTLSIGKFTLNPVGLITQGSVQESDWKEIGDFLERMEGSIQWLLGDWLVYGAEREWGETYRTAAEKSGRDITTMYDYAKVAGKVPFEVRTLNLTFGHHKLVASDKLTNEEKSDWLQRALENHWSVAQMRAAMRPGFSGKLKPFLSTFQKRLTPLYEEFKELKSIASPEDRQQAAAWLRQWADEIESQEE